MFTCLHHMVILLSYNKITDFLMILELGMSFNGCVGMDDKMEAEA